MSIDEAMQKIAEQRARFPREAGADENLGGYLLGLEDALRMLRGHEPEWQAGPFDAHAARCDPWQDNGVQ